MGSDYSNFPTKKEVLESIERLKSIDWPVFSDYQNTKEFKNDVVKILFDEFKIIPNICFDAEPSFFTFPIYRVREVNTFTDINLFTEHSYPPIEKTNKLGRCNFPNNPVFYCSNNPMISLIEVIRNSDYKNREFCISKWEIIKSDKRFVFQSYLHTNHLKGSPFNQFREFEINKINNLFPNTEDSEKKDGFIEYLKFLHNIFIDDKYYSISASLANQTMNSNINFSADVLMYPSIQSFYKGVNMAMRPNFVDNMLELKMLYKIEVNSIDEKREKFNFSIKEYGKIDRNVIIWRNVDPNDKIYNEIMKIDFKDVKMEWVKNINSNY